MTHLKIEKWHTPLNVEVAHILAILLIEWFITYNSYMQTGICTKIFDIRGI